MRPRVIDPVDESRRILRQAESRAIPLRATGGVAIALRAPSVRRLRPQRTYDGIDLVGIGPVGPIEALLRDLGYAPRPSIALDGSGRLRFRDEAGHRLDVSLGVLRMCHDLPLADRLTVDPLTLPLADLLLATIRCVDLTEEDVVDAAAILADHPLTDDESGIGMRRIAAICANDWGWWKTVDGNLRALVARWRDESSSVSADEARILVAATMRATGLRDRLTSTPKSTTWRLRAVVGERVRWYDARDGST
jgi:hypothetical protein